MNAIGPDTGFRYLDEPDSHSSWFCRGAGLPLTVALVRFTICMAILSNGMLSHAQKTLTFTFDDEPQAPGTGRIIGFYEQGAMECGGRSAGGFTIINGVGLSGQFPDNGGTYIQAMAGQSVVFYYGAIPTFRLLSVDLAGYSDIHPGFSVPFVGYRIDGSTVTNTFTGNSLDFHTYYFGPEFSDLTRVEIPTYGWSLDNLVYSIPAPVAVPLTLQVNMAVQIARGAFNPANGDTVQVTGSFFADSLGSWRGELTLTNDPVNPVIYRGTCVDTNDFLWGRVQYGFAINHYGTFENWSHFFTITSTNATTAPPEFFNFAWNLGSLSIGPVINGQTTLSWKAGPFIWLQAADGLSGLWQDIEGTQGQGSATVSVGPGRRYFRLRGP